MAPVPRPLRAQGPVLPGCRLSLLHPPAPDPRLASLTPAFPSAAVTQAGGSRRWGHAVTWPPPSCFLRLCRSARRGVPTMREAELKRSTNRFCSFCNHNCCFFTSTVLTDCCGIMDVPCVPHRPWRGQRLLGLPEAPSARSLSHRESCAFPFLAGKCSWSFNYYPIRVHF